jgi:hypothetical protein
MLSKRQSTTWTPANLATALGIPLLGLALSSCAPATFATFAGAKASLPHAEYQVLGKTKYDNTWINKTIEAEVAGFGMKRPLRRPPSLDARPAAQRVVVMPAVAPAIPLASPPAPPVVSVAPVKKSLTQRLRDRVDALNAKVRKLEGR